MSESQNIEYKKTWRDEYLKWICGFANAQGGKLFIGMDDDGSVAGVENAKKLLEDIPNKIVSLLGIVADVDLHRKNKKEYIRINVPPYNVPISYKGVYHYRSGSTKQELTGAALQDFILKKMGLSWDDATYTSAKISDMDKAALNYFLQKAVSSARLSEKLLSSSVKTVLENLNLIGSDGKLKNAAILLFAKNPLKFFPAVEFKIGRFGNSESDLMFQDVIEGNILEMADKVIAVLRSKYLISPIHYEGLERKEPLEIPEDALREAIFNAIIHKNYAGAAIQMKVYNDKITLWNEGDLPQDFTDETLKQPHASKPRNKNIANAFYKAGFIEAWGRGIDKICDGFKDAGIAEPIFESKFGGMLVTMPRANQNSTQNETTQKTAEDCTVNDETTQKTLENYPENGETTQKIIENYPGNDETPQKTSQKTSQKIIDLLKENPYISRSELSVKCNISSDGVKWQLNKLKDEGKIRRIGPDKGGYWEVK